MSQDSLGLSKFQDAAKPSHRLGELLSVNRCKAKKIVDASTEELKSRSIQDATARSTKSGLRLWQSFATDFLDYDNLATIPPRSGSDVCKYVYLFNNHGTCANYISHLRWACNNQNVNMEWDTGELKQAMKGIGQLSTFYFQGPLGCIFLMTEPQCFLVTAYYRGKRDWDMVACILLGWEMLLRMQSEGLCVYRGQDGNIFGDNPNGVWVCPTTGDLIFKMKVRKNRRHGSTLRRACRCHGKPADTFFCGACFFRQYMKATDVVTNVTLGKLLWDMKATDFVTKIRRAMCIMSVPDGHKFHCKSFRAGRATDLRKRGVAFPEMCAMGEWAKARTACVYANDDAVDPNRVLCHMLEASDEEGDEGEKEAELYAH